MKKLISIFLGWMALLLPIHAQGIVRIDSIFSEYSTKHGHSLISIAYPSTDNSVFNASMNRQIKGFVDAMLSKSDLDAFQDRHPAGPQEMKTYNDEVCKIIATALGKEWEEDVLKEMDDESEDSYYNGVICEHTLEFNIINDQPRYMCVCVIDYGFFGGVHGFTGIFPMIVRKSDGMFMKDIFREDRLEKLRVLLETNMKKDDFGVLELQNYESDDLKGKKEMAEIIRDYGPFPEPEHAWTDGKKFYIQYQQYEIAPYAYGAPVIIVPMNIIRPYLNDEVRDLLNL